MPPAGANPSPSRREDGSLIVGSGPAKFAPALDRTILLKEGKILVMTVDKTHLVRTPLCSATIPVDTAAIIEYQPDGRVHITSLAGGKVTVTLSRNEETCILTAAAGEQLLLCDSAVPAEMIEELSYNGVPHERINNWSLDLSGLRGRKIKFDRQRLAVQEWLLSCSNRCVNQAQQKRIQQLLQSMNSPAPALKTMRQSGRPFLKMHHDDLAASNGYSPVAYVSDAVVAAVNLMTLTVPEGSIRYLEKSKLNLHTGGIITFEQGEILLHAQKSMSVKAGPAMLHLKPGSIAVVSLNNGMLKVRNIYERATASITAGLPDKCLGVQSGQELIIGDKGLSLAKALSDEPVGRRRLRSVDLPCGYTAICAEISLNSLMQNSAILSRLLRSTSPSDRQLASKIAKMAVCLSLVTSAHGNYSICNQ